MAQHTDTQAGLTSLDEVAERLAAQGYIADDDIRMAVFLAARLGKPLLVEGPPGVGKTEIARTLSAALDTELLRLQCYEGLDASQALYEWNYQRQLLAIKAQEHDNASLADKEALIFSEDFLLERPLLAALRHPRPAVLLIDELDRADEAFESFLLEILAEWQVSIPELGTLRARHIPHVVITGNRTRPLADATRRRCLYLWIGYPDRARELRIVQSRLPAIDSTLGEAICDYVASARDQALAKAPGVAETLDWAAALMALGEQRLAAERIDRTLGLLFKDPDDLQIMRARLRQDLEQRARA